MPLRNICFPYCFSLGSLVSAQWFPILPRELAWNPTCSSKLHIVAHSCTALNEFSKFPLQFSVGIFQEFHIVPHNFQVVNPRSRQHHLAGARWSTPSCSCPSGTLIPAPPRSVGGKISGCSNATVKTPKSLHLETYLDTLFKKKKHY